MYQKTIFVVLVLLAFMHTSVHAGSLDGVELPDSTELAGQNLVLNGMGTRKATVFKVKVYVMGLYLTEKREGAKSIIQSETAKRITLQFIRDAGAEKIRKGWQKGFEKNSTDLPALQDRIDQLNNAMKDMSKGDSMKLDFTTGRVDVVINGVKETSIEGADFQRALLAVWLGPNPPNKTLKAGILGKK